MRTRSSRCEQLANALSAGDGARTEDLIDSHLRWIEESLDVGDEAEAQDLRSILVAT